MTAKEKAVQYIQSLPDEVGLGEIVERLHVIHKIEIGIAQADAGERTDHDAFFDELEADDAARDRLAPKARRVHRAGLWGQAIELHLTSRSPCS